MRAKHVAKLLGTITLFVGLSMLVPGLVSAGYGEWSSALSFAVSVAVTVAFGGALMWYGRGELGTVFRREALVVVAAAWTLTGVFGGLPLWLGGMFASPVDAYFEAVSGFTTTGATVLVDIDDPSLSHGLHFWRVFTHWLGGIGIVVLFVAVFPQLGVGGKVLFKSEVAGPITEGLRPKIRETSQVLFRVYVTLTVLCGLLLVLVGMGPFDAAAHALSTLGTGGFSTRGASVAAFDSWGVDMVITVFMVLAGVNFGLYYMAVRGGGLKRALRDEELWVYLAVILLATLVMTADLRGRHANVAEDLRYAVFQVVAIVTTTGFATDNFDEWPNLSRTMFFLLFFVGGMAGSTAGGLKIIRAIILVKGALRELVQTFRPQAVTAIKLGRRTIDPETVRGVYVHFAVYLVIFAVASLITATMTDDIVTASTSVIACLGNVGPGLAGVGAVESYAFFPVFGKLFLAGLMILGRLEMFTLLVLLVPSFWRQ
jgi:trk system potassium uptake protein